MNQPDAPGNIDLKTVEGFGEEWAAYDQEALDPEEHRRLFQAYFSPFPFDALPPGAVGFDLGCGTGRWAALAAERVGHLHCIDPSEKALDVARRRLSGRANVTLHQAGVDTIPLPDGSQDFGYSLGVLHHIPDTAKAMASCVRKLKPGAPFLVYIYYNFDNRPRWFRGLWKISDLGRIAISRLPFRLRKAITVALATLIYYPLTRIALLLERAGFNVDPFPLSAYRHSSFYTMRTDALDRFGTRLEQRFPRSRIRQMMIQSGLGDIAFREAVPYWVACGRKRTEVETKGPRPLADADPGVRSGLKVVHAVPLLTKGGGERVTVDLANHAAEAGCEVTILSAFSGDPDLLPAPLHPRVRLLYVCPGRRSPLGRYVGVLPWAIRNRRWLAEQDILHCHMTFGAVLGATAQLVAALTGTRRPAVVETYHAVGEPIPRRHRWLHARLAGWRDAVALMAEDRFWTSFLDRRPQLPSRIIPNGISFKAPTRAGGEELAAYRQAIGIPPECELVMGTVGRLAPERQPALYIPVFAGVARAFGPKVHFVVAGAGPELGRLQSLVRDHGIEGQVHFTGMARDPSLPMSLVDLYITVAVGSVAGIAALEAAALGRPVVGVQVLRDFRAEPDHWFWSSADLDAVADHSIGLLGDPAARETLGRRQQEHVRANHTVERMAGAYHALYRRALERLEPQRNAAEGGLAAEAEAPR